MTSMSLQHKNKPHVRKILLPALACSIALPGLLGLGPFSHLITETNVVRKTTTSGGPYPQSSDSESEADGESYTDNLPAPEETQLGSAYITQLIADPIEHLESVGRILIIHSLNPPLQEFQHKLHVKVSESEQVFKGAVHVDVHMYEFSLAHAFIELLDGFGKSVLAQLAAKRFDGIEPNVPMLLQQVDDLDEYMKLIQDKIDEYVSQQLSIPEKHLELAGSAIDINFLSLLGSASLEKLLSRIDATALQLTQGVPEKLMPAVTAHLKIEFIQQFFNQVKSVDAEFLHDFEKKSDKVTYFKRQFVQAIKNPSLEVLDQLAHPFTEALPRKIMMSAHKLNTIDSLLYVAKTQMPDLAQVDHEIRNYVDQKIQSCITDIEQYIATLGYCKTATKSIGDFSAIMTHLIIILGNLNQQ